LRRGDRKTVDSPLVANVLEGEIEIDLLRPRRKKAGKVQKAFLCRCQFNLSHAGERMYTGHFDATLRSALPVAVGAPEGQRIHVTGLNNLKPNPR